MRKIIIITALLALTVGSAFAGDNASAGTDVFAGTNGRIADLLFLSVDAPFEMLQSGIDAVKSDKLNMQTTLDPNRLNPGKALLLSAIIPGAGEYYAGSKWKAAMFLGIEVVAWTAVIYYYNAGQDKDKEFKEFADAHFDAEIYRRIEFERAQSDDDSEVFGGTREAWQELPWGDRIQFLPDQGFTHNLPDDAERSSNSGEDQQYYEMIGKYIGQFGWGWDDVYDANLNIFLGDDEGTPYYDNLDGAARLSSHYMDMRYDSNQLLDNSALATQIAMLNHVASALDASFTVRMMNRNADAKVGFRQINYDGHPMAVGGLNFRW